ncbi:MAG TPA: DNA-protecting protein DprA [Caldithrix abyssi]|uniref:DNA-protecting protein DprA n=1 Tax=Caldithrix abyssi TaxID=187145 RepID=A0A7V5RPR6_CALAY|nr:DNA-protecting protein DprA [Caldithrix abyssi]
MSASSLEALLALFSVPGIGPARMRALIGSLGSAEAVLDSSPRQLMHTAGIDKKPAHQIKNGVNETFVKNQLAHLRQTPARIITYWDKEYPRSLKAIYDPPALLFVEGDASLMDQPAVAVVGTRVPSAYGKHVTDSLTRELCRQGLVIASGFARGVDTIAHKAALSAGGHTLAVLGNGLDVIYPSENRVLLEPFARKGLRISEYPFGTKPDSGNFPKRNRIISGLSLGVLVVEAGEKSGALLTAMYALDQNREVFAVPGPISSPKSAGTNNLIKQGAKLVQNVDDILSELGGVAFEDKKEEKPEPALEEPALSIYRFLGNEPRHIDQIALECRLSPSEALNQLLMLELNGHIRQLAGKMFVQR